jgi:hypothetical protein
MKKNYIYIFIVAILLPLSACSDFLEIQPKDRVDQESFYKTETDCNLALNSMYDKLQLSGTYNNPEWNVIPTDVVKSATWNSQGLGDYNILPNHKSILIIWSDHFRAINEANIVINYTPNADFSDEKERQRIIYEAKFVRSLMYFNLVRFYGNIPWIDKPTTYDSDLLPAQLPDSVIYNHIISDLDSCRLYLKHKGEIDPGHATVEAAEAILASIYITRASMEKYRRNNGVGNAKSMAYYQQAAYYCEQVLNSGKFSLVRYYPDVFTPKNKNNNEIIFSVQFASGKGTEGSKVGSNMGINGEVGIGGAYGNYESTQYYQKIFAEDDSIRRRWNTVRASIMREKDVDPAYIFKYKTTIDFVLRIPGETGALLQWKEGADYRAMAMGKFRRWPVQAKDYSFEDWNCNWPVIRLAEIYMFYAEALVEINGKLDTEKKAEFYINELRKRARTSIVGGVHLNQYPREYIYNVTSMPDLDFNGWSGKLILDFLKKESARELGGELQRWFDLVRWNDLVKTIRDLGTSYNSQGRKLEGDNWGDKNIKDYHMLLPIPTSEILANPNLKQNVGYY